MGLLSGIANAIAGPIGSILVNPGSSSGYGTNGLIGEALNDITGQSSSARQQYRYNLALQKNAQDFAKWQMANSHQQEVADLQKAGLNPVLSAGGTGADAGGVAPSTTGAGGGGHDPFTMAAAVMGMINSAKMTKATVDNLDSQSNLNNETGAKTHTEKEILDIQKNYIAPMEESIIALNQANTGLSNQNKLKAFEETVKTNAEAFHQKIINEMAYMDKAKRKSYYEQEVALYKTELQKQIASSGLESSVTYQAINHAMDTVGKVFHGGLNYNYGNATINSTTNSSTTVRHRL